MQVAHPHSGSPSTFPDQINWNLEILVWKKGENGDARPKTSQSNGRTNKKLNTHMASTPRHETQWWEGNVLTAVPPLFPWIEGLTSNR